MFVKVPTLAQDFPVKERVTFLEQEYLTPEYKIEPYANYLDSTQTPIRQYESYMVIDQVKNDTILFQEVSFYLLNGNLFTNYIVYDNLDTREEMRLLLVDVANKLKQSVKDREK